MPKPKVINKSKNMPRKSKPTNSLVWVGGLSFNKTLVAVVAVMVVSSGGYFYFKGSHAATTLPATPPAYATSYSEVWFRTTDGTITNPTYQTNPSGYIGFCMNFLASSSYGPIARCYELNAAETKYRTILYSQANSHYTPDSAWVSITGSTILSIGNNNAHPLDVYKCADTGNYVSGIGFYTPLGYLVVGQQYRVVGLTRQVGFTNYSDDTHKCTPVGAWYTLAGPKYWSTTLN